MVLHVHDQRRGSADRPPGRRARLGWTGQSVLLDRPQERLWRLLGNADTSLRGSRVVHWLHGLRDGRLPERGTQKGRVDRSDQVRIRHQPQDREGARPQCAAHAARTRRRGHRMRRREFITLLGGAAVAWPLPARGQQPALPVVAFLAVGSPDALRGRVVAFPKGHSETGWIEDRNVGIEYHWLEGNYVGLPAVLDDVIGRGVAVLAIPGSVPISVAAKAATATIPIVFGVAEDPVLLGLVKSLAHPGGN